MLKKLTKFLLIVFSLFLIPSGYSHAKNDTTIQRVEIYTDLPWEEYIIPEYNALPSYFVRRSYNGYIYEGRLYRTNIRNEFGHYLYKGVLYLSAS